MGKVNQSERDSFWDIQKLIPQKKDSARTVASKKQPYFSEITLDSSNVVSSETRFSNASRKKSTPPHSFSYEKLSSLIRHVEVIDWKNSYHYYEYFCKNALYFNDKKGERCERVPFFSYVAQYSQMSREQLAWYLWWRENARKGIYLDTDVSYLLLHFYEIINLGSALNTKKALSDMIAIWAHYRNTYPQLDSTVADWICDYSLIHQIPIPFPHELITRDMIGRCSLREIYYSFDPSNWELFAKFLLTYCNTYNYRKSKFYTAETAGLYEEHIVGGLSALLQEKRSLLLDGRCHLRKVSRVAFTGALCSYRMRKRIEVEYLSLSDTEELRDTITAVIKYCENKLRAHLGIRSRLGVRETERDVLAVLDGYFAERGLLSDRETGRDVAPEYEKLYEVKDTTFSVDRAMEIERSSWNMTALLVDEFDNSVPCDTEHNLKETVLSTLDEENASPMTRFMKSISQYAEFMQFVLSGNVKNQLEYCKARGLLPAAVADEINEKSVDCFEDILLEEDSGGYAVIEDYRSMFDEEGELL